MFTSFSNTAAGGDAMSSVASPLTALQFALPTGAAAGSSSNKEKSFKAKEMRRVRRIVDIMA